jgi:hypothetical protein
MGEWSEYFEDFPEENPAHWVNGQFHPGLPAQLKLASAQQADASLVAHQLKLIMNAYAKLEQKAKSLVATEDCPQCGLTELRTYKLSETFYLCECQDCGIYGAGQTHEEALAKTAGAVGEDSIHPS